MKNYYVSLYFMEEYSKTVKIKALNVKDVRKQIKEKYPRYKINSIEYLRD